MLGYYYLSISPVGTPDIENEMKIPAAATAIAVVDKTKREANVNMKEATTATNKTNLKTNKVCRKIDQQKKQMKKAKKKQFLSIADDTIYETMIISCATMKQCNL